MNTTQSNEKSIVGRLASLVVITAAVATLTGCGHTMAMIRGTGAKRPVASEFGLGPRASIHGRYRATLEPTRPLRPRQMQTVRVTVVDGDGRAIDGATLTIDGGMPQHGHGLPTRPRVTKSLGGGSYEIEGVRFNMGGWWEFKVAITAGTSADTVVFNLDL
jgi:hypothetical protein